MVMVDAIGDVTNSVHISRNNSHSLQLLNIAKVLLQSPYYSSYVKPHSSNDRKIIHSYIIPKGKIAGPEKAQLPEKNTILIA